MKPCVLNSGVSSYAEIECEFVRCLSEGKKKKSYSLIFLSFLEAGNRSLLGAGTSWLLETTNSDKCIISSLVRKP